MAQTGCKETRMAALWLGLGMGAIQGVTSLLGGQNQAQAAADQARAQAQAAQFEAWKNKRQFEHNEFVNRMGNQIKNRQISKVNAHRWMKNRKLAEAANINRAEEEFWIRWNFDNDAEILSKKHQQVNNTLIASLDKRNINIRSGNARQLLRASHDNASDQMVKRRLSFRNQMKSAERKQTEALAQRDFGYNSHTTLIPGLYIDSPTIDPNEAYNSALSTGMTGALLSGISGAAGGFASGYAMGDMMGQMNPSTPPPGGGGGGGGGGIDPSSWNTSGFDPLPNYSDILA